MAQAPVRVLGPDRVPVVLTQMVKPPVIYETWWREIAKCESLPLPLEHKKLTWVVVPATTFTFEDTTIVHGWLDAATIMPVMTIYVRQDKIFDELLIKHEMIHALLYWKYHGAYNRGTNEEEHPSPWYRRCMMEIVQ